MQVIFCLEANYLEHKLRILVQIRHKRTGQARMIVKPAG